MKEQSTYKPKENSVLRIDLNGDIKERSIKNPFGDVRFRSFYAKAFSWFK
jgi:hypothetical protein